MEFAIPSKTFLLGEYLALRGGPSVILATRPLFRASCSQPLVLTRLEPSPKSPFHVLSPAGRLLTQIGKPQNFDFYDPHLSRGGFGASTAEFLAVYLSSLSESECFDLKNGKPSAITAMLERYWGCLDLAPNQERPSGADLVAQVFGQVTVYSGQSFSVESLPWSFADLSFSLWRTGNKIKTHEHLREKIRIPEDELRAATVDGIAALRAADGSRFLKCVEQFSRLLRSSRLQHADTANLTEEFASEFSGEAVAKGCGALGADVLAIVCANETRDKVLRWAQLRGLEFVADQSGLARGALV